MNKSIWHSVLHVLCAAFLLVQMFAISDLRADGAEMRGMLVRAAHMLRAAADVCERPSSEKVSREQ